MFDKRYQVSVTFFTVKHFPNSVDAAMPNIQLLLILPFAKLMTEPRPSFFRGF